MGERRGEEYKGRAKEAAGDLADDDDLKREGKADQASASVKRAADKAKDKFDDATERVKDVGKDDDEQQ